ncbi:duf51 family protein [Cystoisospora suis]|uniref:Duf51 family protein n=1 Tax=Cystoisospora suis TaxID=483139 RepID=A0A2C6KI64_9APIC|nr:duf51 family protein [Cystoisospora suis]
MPSFSFTGSPRRRRRLHGSKAGSSEIPSHQSTESSLESHSQETCVPPHPSKTALLLSKRGGGEQQQEQEEEEESKRTESTRGIGESDLEMSGRRSFPPPPSSPGEASTASSTHHYHRHDGGHHYHHSHLNSNSNSRRRSEVLKGEGKMFSKDRQHAGESPDRIGASVASQHQKQKESGGRMITGEGDRGGEGREAGEGGDETGRGRGVDTRTRRRRKTASVTQGEGRQEEEEEEEEEKEKGYCEDEDEDDGEDTDRGDISEDGEEGEEEQMKHNHLNHADGHGSGKTEGETALKAEEEMCAWAFDLLIAHLEGYAERSPAPPSLLRLHQAGVACPAFVTWVKRRRGATSFSREDTDLRGCIGSLSPIPVLEIGDYVLTSALRDRRFKPITLREVPHLKCHVSLLHSYETVEDPLDWEIGVHGTTIKFTDDTGRRYSATYLPEIAKELGMTKHEALASLVKKAGYHGAFTDDLLSQISLTRYQSSQARLDYEKYVKVYGRFTGAAAAAACDEEKTSTNITQWRGAS